MPRDWVKTIDFTAGAPDRSGALAHAAGLWGAGDPPGAELHLWPYRSLPRRGFAGFILLTCILIAMPLLAVLGSPVMWGVLPFFVLAVAGLWVAINRSYRDGEVTEVLRLWSDRIELQRNDPRRPQRAWSANPHWVRVELHVTGGPVPHYLTLRGGDREVEIGAFLSEAERVELRGELQRALAATR